MFLSPSCESDEGWPRWCVGCSGPNYHFEIGMFRAGEVVPLALLAGFLCQLGAAFDAVVLSALMRMLLRLTTTHPWNLGLTIKE